MHRFYWIAVISSLFTVSALLILWLILPERGVWQMLLKPTLPWLALVFFIQALAIVVLGRFEKRKGR
jgi:hypothetical protein